VLNRVKTLKRDVGAGMLDVSSTDPGLTEEEEEAKLKRKLTRQQTWKKAGTTAKVMSKLGSGMGTHEDQQVVSSLPHSYHP
jgi:hypothetical protein